MLNATCGSQLPQPTTDTNTRGVSQGIDVSIHPVTHQPWPADYATLTDQQVAELYLFEPESHPVISPKAGIGADTTVSTETDKDPAATDIESGIACHSSAPTILDAYTTPWLCDSSLCLQNVRQMRPDKAR